MTDDLVISHQHFGSSAKYPAKSLAAYAVQRPPSTHKLNIFLAKGIWYQMQAQKTATTIFFFLFSFLISSCGNDNENQDLCLECSESSEIKEFSGIYLRYLDDFRYRRMLFYDSTEQVELHFNLCSPEEFDSLESEKIIRASGNFHNPCPPDSVINILINNYDIVEICPNEIPDIAGEFDLINEWTFNNIITNDSMIYLPCESAGSYLNIITYSGNEDFDLQFGGAAAENGFTVNVVVSEDTLFLPTEFTRTLSIGTRSETSFESIYFQVLYAEAKIKFEISNNHLNLRNLENNVELNFYTK